MNDDGSVPNDAQKDTLIRRLACAINNAAANYRVGELQSTRKALRNMSRMPSSTIFGKLSVKDNFAFHTGGRSELQFNIGEDLFKDGTLACRAGVAFSLKESKSLQDWRVLIPRIRLFNDYMRESPETFAGMSMWHWSGADMPNEDREPGPIDPEILQKGNFIFLGERRRPEEADAVWCLEVFDRLFGLWLEVQSGVPATDIDLAPVVVEASRLMFERGMEEKTVEMSRGTRTEQQFDIVWRHNEIQNRLMRELQGAGAGTVRLEVPCGRKFIDVVLKHGETFTFYEVKVAATVRQCLREAIGQLLEYALWLGAERPDKIVVVGEPELTLETEAYLASLNQAFPIKLEYRQVVVPEVPAD